MSKVWAYDLDVVDRSWRWEIPEIDWEWRLQRIFRWSRNCGHGDVMRVPYINTKRLHSSGTRFCRSQVGALCITLTLDRGCFRRLLARSYLLSHSVIRARSCTADETQLPRVQLWLSIPRCIVSGWRYCEISDLGETSKMGGGVRFTGWECLACCLYFIPFFC
jgi:hypothetical protein